LNSESNHITPEYDLIKGCIDGNRLMQKELYDRYSPRMYSVCLRYAFDEEEAQDILQDGFIKIFTKLESYRHEGSFEGWIRRVIVNTAIEYYRRRKYTQTIDDKFNNTIDNKGTSAIDKLGEKDIINLIQQISPGYRAVFNMYVIEGYSHREIAEILNISEGTSKSQLSRGRAILQDLVNKFLNEHN
jgi:RNA polymerase sigma factor (sigma-70 family)